MEGEEETKMSSEQRQFSEKDLKLVQFIRAKPTRKKLEEFMKANPDLIIYVSKDQMREAHRQEEDKQRPRFTRVMQRKKTPTKPAADEQQSS